MDKERLLRDYAFEGLLDPLRQFIDEGVNLEGTDTQGFTPLHLAMLYCPHAPDKDYKTVVETLVEAGADIHHAADNGQTPLITAAVEGHADILAYLHKRGADVNALLDTGCTALFCIGEGVENRPLNVSVTVKRDGKEVTLTDPAEIRQAIGHHPDDEYDAYIRAARYLIDHGIDLNAKTHKYKQTAVFIAASVGADELVAMMLNTGRIAVNYQDTNGATALHYASRGGHLKIVEMLVEAGADVNLGEEYGYTPLHEAAEYGHVDVARFLIAHGADPAQGVTKSFAPYQAGDTALDVAKKANKKDVAQFLAQIIA